MFRGCNSNNNQLDVGSSDISNSKRLASNCKANDWIAIGVSIGSRTAAVLRRGKQMEKKLPHYYLSWIVSFYKLGKTAGSFLLRNEKVRRGTSPKFVSSESGDSRRSTKQYDLEQLGLQTEAEKNRRSIEIWNIQNLKQERKLENLRKRRRRKQYILQVSAKCNRWDRVK